MKSQILIDVEPNMSSVSLLEDNRLKEHYVEYKEASILTGNIYKGRVENVLQGLQTAFVNIGLPRNGFLFVGETMDHRSVLMESQTLPGALDVKIGDYVMVQATKEETGGKGARLTANISLPGRYLVYLPTLDFVGVSNKITDESTREKLLKLLNKLKTPLGGFIARTVCLDAKKSDIESEAQALKEQYASIKAKYDAAYGVSLVHKEGNLIIRAVRDLLNANVESVICNDKATAEEIKERFGRTHAKLRDKVMFYESDYDLVDVFGIFNEVDRLLDRKVTLPSGGSLVIDRTEALTAIDVNTGSFVGAGSHEDTVYRTNIEAAVEIARQLRLRNIGGIIVVDFIDMMVDGHKSEVVEALKKEMLFDRSKTRVLDMSGVGLVEITRKKAGSELGSILLETCPHCKGLAHTQSPEYVARKIKARLKHIFAEDNYEGAIVTASTNVYDYMFSARIFSDICERDWAEKRIYAVPSENPPPGGFSVVGTRSRIMNLPKNARLLY